METLIRRILTAVVDNNTIVVFVGNMSLVGPVTTSLVQNLPDTYNATIDIQLIDNSTHYLRGHAFCVSFYHDSCFRYVSPHEFLQTHYNWLRKQVKGLYGTQPLQSFDVDDLFQEVCMTYLDKILSKYDGKCNLRVFVANRLRRYVQYILNAQLKVRLSELEYTLNGVPLHED